MKTMYINQLSEEMQDNIFDDVKATLIEQGLSEGIELDEALNDAMNSRLCDLSDTIDIAKYL